MPVGFVMWLWLIGRGGRTVHHHRCVAWVANRPSLVVHT
jgi:hypothetical protein